MPIDTSIYNQLAAPKFESPMNSLANALPLVEAMQKNKLMQQQMADNETLNNLYRNAVGPDGKIDRAAILSGAAQGGLGSKIPGMQKQFADADKAQFDGQKTQVEMLTNANGLIGSAAYAVLQNPTPQNAQQIVAGLRQQFGPQLSAQLGLDNMQIPADPMALKEWANNHYLKSIETEKLLADATSRRNNDQNNATSRANNAATNATTRRGQDLVDARAKEAVNTPEYKQDADGNWIALPKKVAAGGQIVAQSVLGSDGQPLKAAPKPPTEFQGKSAAYGARAEQADKIITSLTGNYSPAAVNTKQAVGGVPLLGGALEAGANKMLSASSQKAEQAQRDFVNAVLRQESGAAISPSEFDNAKKQYFPQPGDGPAVIAQKAENRKLAIQGFKQSAGKAAFSAPKAATSNIDDLLKKYGD